MLSGVLGRAQLSTRIRTVCSICQVVTLWYPQVPAKLENMPISRFRQLLRPGRRRAKARLYYDREYYYWSGQPPTHMGHHPERPPLSCLLRPTGPPPLFPVHFSRSPVPSPCCHSPRSFWTLFVLKKVNDTSLGSRLTCLCMYVAGDHSFGIGT